MVEIEGMIKQKSISILIDPGAILSYILPTVVESCKLKKVKHEKPWIVQLAIGKKRKVFDLIKYYMVNMVGMDIKVDLYILPLISYDLLIGMDWLEKHLVVVNCCENNFDFLDDFGQRKTIKGIPLGVSVR